MAKKTPADLAKLLRYIMGVRPDEFGIFPDKEGYFLVKEILAVLREEGFGYARLSHLQEVANHLPGSGIELVDKKVRLSPDEYPDESNRLIEEVFPPNILYYACKRKTYPAVLKRGLLPHVQKEYVHLVEDKEMALRLGKRSDMQPILITVYAEKAYKAGVKFFKHGELLYLTYKIPPEFLVGPKIEISLEEERKPKPKVQKKKKKEKGLPGSFILDEMSIVKPREKRRRKKDPQWKRDRRRGRGRRGF